MKTSISILVFAILFLALSSVCAALKPHPDDLPHTHPDTSSSGDEVVFSSDEGHYVAAIRKDGDTRDVIFYGKLADGVTFDGLKKYMDVDASTLDKFIRPFYDQILQKKMLLRQRKLVHEAPPINVYIPASYSNTVCEQFKDTQYFRCYKAIESSGVTDQEYLDEIQTLSDKGRFYFLAVPSSEAGPYFTLSTALAATSDADADGVPNLLDNCPEDPNFDQADVCSGEGEEVEEEVVEKDVDISDTVSTTPQLPAGFDEGGGCSLAPASGPSGGLLAFMFSIAILAIRRSK
jgi:hypothetical protein